VSSNGYLFYRLKNDAKLNDSLKIKLTQFAQYTFLSTLTSKEKDIDLEVKLIPIIDGKAEPENIAKRMVNGILEIPEKDSVSIFIKNSGTADVYFNILDLQPDGVINPILPKKGRDGVFLYTGGPAKMKIGPGQSINTFKDGGYKVKISPPYGMEIFKVFASSNVLDLESITTSKGSGQGEELKPMAQLLSNSFNGASARGATSEGTIFDVLFRIKPKL
jgi:hypothetical protein